MWEQRRKHYMTSNITTTQSTYNILLFLLFHKYNAFLNIFQQAVVRGTTNPAPCCHLCNWLVNVSPLLPPSECNWLWAMAGDNKQLDLRPADPFTRIDPKLNQVVPWSLHAFPEISCKSVQPFCRNVADKEINNETKKERKKERNRSITIPRPPIGGRIKIFSSFVSWDVFFLKVFVRRGILRFSSEVSKMWALVLSRFVRKTCRSNGNWTTQTSSDEEHFPQWPRPVAWWKLAYPLCGALNRRALSQIKLAYTTQIGRMTGSINS